MKIKIKLINSTQKLTIIPKGDWIDLYAAESVEIIGPKAFKGVVKINKYMIPLGIAMKLPRGYEAIIAPRSSTYKTCGLVAANSIGIIDNSYSGNNDQWFFSTLALKDGNVEKGDRVCQFRIQLSQKATIWQKIKWLFSKKITFEYVNELDCEDRNGFGKGTGAK